MTQKSVNKSKDLTSLLFALAIIVLLNVVFSFVFTRIDLTSEKRYTLSSATKNLLKDLDDVVYVKVYLEGEFPAGFKRLRNETKEMLDEFRAYAGDNVEYEFINPLVNVDKKEQKQIIQQLMSKGLQPTNLEVKEENGVSQQIIFPGALVSYRGKEIAWQLLKTQLMQAPEAQLNASVQALEYELASNIKNLTTPIKPRVAIIQGQGELDSLRIRDFKESVEEYYPVDYVSINQQLKALDNYKAIVIAKPDTAFSERDKFIIDQFVMKGGRVLWILDPLNTSIDSLLRRGSTLAIPYQLNLEDMLFTYGTRVNNNMVIDVQCSAIPVNKALRGQAPRFELMPWLFYPIIMAKSNHPIVNNLDVSKLEYASSIDTISASGIAKTILLQTSKFSKTLTAPVRVDLNYLRFQPDEKQFKDAYQTIAVLLEGKFTSLYKNRLSPIIAKDSGIAFKEQGLESKMIVISDGDFIKNDIIPSTGKPLPLGYDKYTKQNFGNKNFALNCINYLCDDSGLISVRSRELKLRLLDKQKIKSEKLKWQLINLILPLMLVLVYGLVYTYWRRKKYTK
jgi:ABC-2 type transport system permease protein